MFRQFFAVAVFVAAISISSIFAQSDTKASPTPSPTPEISTSINPRRPERLPEVLISPPALRTLPSGYTRPDSKTRFKRYVNGIVGPVALGRQVARAGISTWQNSPEEWGPHWEGFGKRMASNFGKNLIKQTTVYGLDTALKYDSHYYRSEKKDAASKIKNALLSTVTARDRNGKRVVGIPRIVGTYTSSIIAAETWYPDRYDWKDGVRNGTFSFAMSAGFNLFKEFIWKK